MNSFVSILVRGIRFVPVLLLLVGLTIPIGCDKPQTNDNVPRPRIISQSPVITQILFDLGLGDHIVGVTNWCDLPAEGKYSDINRIADARGIRTEMAILARPDIIFTQSDPERGLFKNVVNNLPDVKVIQLKIESIKDIFDAVEKIGQATGQEQVAAKLAEGMQEKLAVLKPAYPQDRKLRMLFSSSHESPMVAGPGTYIDDLFKLAGAENAGKEIPGSMLWRKSKVENIIAAKPDVLIIFSMSGRKEQVKNFWLGLKDIPAARSGRVFVVTDTRWLRPDTKVVELAGELQKMLTARESK